MLSSLAEEQGATMDMQEAMLEERYAGARNEIFRLLSSTSEFNMAVVKVLHEVFKEEVDVTKHGAVLWALMTKGTGIKRGVLGSHFRVYMQYYYHYLVISSQRKETKRVLEPTSLAFITATAAFGYNRGVKEFDQALRANDMGVVNNMIVDRVNFLEFFWTGNHDSFSWCGCWRIIDALWDIWDMRDPVRIHGFISGNLSFQMLKSRSKDLGTFCFRFSSQGGLAVDFVGQGELRKTLWKASAVRDASSFMKLLYDAREGASLRFLIDTSSASFGPNIHPKEKVFPLSATGSYVTSGYQRVADGDEDGASDMSAESYVVNFMDNNTFGGF